MKKIQTVRLWKQMLALALVFCMIFAAGCKRQADDEGTGDGTTNNGGTTENGGSNDNEGSENGGEQEGKQGEEAEEASYTYREASITSPTTFNFHEYQMADDGTFIAYMSSPLYSFIFDESRTGYELVPEMAAGMPVDITSEYAGNETYGIPEGETEGWAFKIPLREDAVWDNGTAINADTYVYSMEQLLNPDMKNFRASGFYSGLLTLANAESYFKSKTPNYVPIATFSEEGDPIYEDKADGEMYFTMQYAAPFFGENSAADYYAAGYADNFLDAEENNLYDKYLEREYYPLTEEAKADLLLISTAFGDDRPEAYKEWCFYIGEASADIVTDFADVGFKKSGEYEITIIASKPITDFNLKYNLTSGFLVYEEYYEQYKEETGDLVKTTYGSSADRVLSYGPYKLVSYQVDKELLFEKNETWFGYADEAFDGMYQANRLVFSIVPEQTTQLQLFLQGNLDTVGLTKDDMANYRNSDFVLYTPGSYTWKLSMNTDFDALRMRETEGINKTILSYKDFRQAVSLSIDRSEYCVQHTAAAKPGFGLISWLYIYDPDTGASYRGSEQAANLFERMYGETDEANITGYNKDEATRLFTKAYEEALAAGHISDTDQVELEFVITSEADVFVQRIQWFNDAISAACVGTPLEGRVTLKILGNGDYYSLIHQGQYEMSITGLGGGIFDPFGMMEWYLADNTEMLTEYGFKSKVETWTINVGGTEVTKTFYDWFIALTEGEYVAADAVTKLEVLAGLEEGVLNFYGSAPLYYDYTASLESRKILHGTDVFNGVMAYGGIQYMTFNYTDEEWAAYCAENNNNLQY